MQSPTGYHQRSIALCLSSHSQIHEKVLIYRPHPYVSRKFTPAIGMRVHVKLVGRFLALLMFFPPISGSSVRQDGFARSPLTLSFPRRRESIPLGQCFTYKVQMHPWDEKGTPTCLGIPLVRIRRIRRITDKRYPVTPTGVLRELFCVTSLKKDLCHQNGGGGIRTPVPRCFKTGFYMRSRFIIFFRLAERHATGSRFSYFGEFLPSRPEQPVQPACYFNALTQPTGKVKAGRAARLGSQAQLIVVA